MQEIVLIPSTSDRTLSGVVFRASDSAVVPKPVALLIHGWTSGQDRMFDVAEALSKSSGTTCLTIDLSGHGKSEGVLGELSRKNFLDDVVAAYDFLAAQPSVDPSKIEAIGSSFGAYLAALLSADRPLTSLILRAPADYPDAGFDTPKPVSNEDDSWIFEWRNQLKKWSETAALRALHAFKGKVLLVESENDELIPSQSVRNFADAVVEKSNLRYEVMKGAPHSITRSPELKAKFVDLVLAWEKQKSVESRGQAPFWESLSN